MATEGLDSLKRRGKALEEAFFQKEADAYRERLRVRAREEAAVEALAEASGIQDPELLRKLAGLGIRAETLAALTLIPLVEVAWADGRMEPRERKAVLSGAESTGISEDGPSHGLLRLWLEDRPAPDLTEVWHEFIAAMCGQLTDEERDHLRSNILGRARRVAEAAGGFLGLRSPVSQEEEEALASLERAFERQGSGL